MAKWNIKQAYLNPRTGKPWTQEELSGTDPAHPGQIWNEQAEKYMTPDEIQGQWGPDSSDWFAGPVASQQGPGGSSDSGGGADAASIIHQWQASHGANEPLTGLIDELKSKGINASAYMYDTTPSGNEITLNGSKYKVKTGDNANWWEPSMGEGGGPGYGSMNAPFTEAFQFDDFTPPDKFSGPTFTAPTDVTEQNDPGYQFRLKEGEKALQRSAAAKGTLLTGGTLKDLNQYGQEYASNEYQNVYNRAYQQYATDYGTKWDEYKTNYGNAFNEWTAKYNKALGEYHDRYGIFSDNEKNQFDRAYSMANLGLQGAGGMAQAGSGYANAYGNMNTNYGQNMTDLITGRGNANAAGTIGSANAWGSSLGNIANNAAFYASMYGQRQTPSYYPGPRGY